MQDKSLNIEKTDKSGYLIFLGTLIFYFLFKLPLNLSVLCSNTNEGFYFIFGQHLLNGTHFDAKEMSYPNLFFYLYALIVKLFGFGTNSIVVVHFIQTAIVVLISVVIYYVVKLLLDDVFYASIAVLFWTLILMTPIGQWGTTLELESSFALEAEYLIVLISLSSVYCLLRTFQNKNPFLMAFLAGFLGASSIMFKASGAVMMLAIVCWIIYLGLFEGKYFINYKNILFVMCLGFICSFILFNIGIITQKNNLIDFWKCYFDVGVYGKEHISSINGFLLSVFNFMTRYTTSLNNFILFFFGFISLGWGLIRNFFVKNNSLQLRLVYPLLNIWAWGNVCSVIAPGGYGSYYYILVWPTIAIFFTLGIYDLLRGILNKKIFKISLVVFITIFFTHRFLVILPSYLSLVKRDFYLSIFFQPESFQDPVNLNLSQNPHRPDFLKVADLINSFLPKRNDTVYILNFKKEGQHFPATTYIYMKRFPPTTAIADYLEYKKYLNVKLKVISKTLINTPPKILLLPHRYYIKPWQAEALTPFLNWLNLFVSENYHLKINLTYADSNTNEIEICDVFERN